MSFLPSDPDPDECDHPNEWTECVFGNGEVVGFQCNKCGHREA